MKKLLFIVLGLFLHSIAFAQSGDPELSSWLLNTSGITGYNGLPANVQKVQYSQNYVYISSSGIPAYTIGPWPGDPNQASDQNFVFQIPRNPAEETGTKTSTPLGTIGVFINGVALFNAKDAHTYNNDGTWHRNAVVVEASSFDKCLGHPQMQGVYHHHQNPGCLYKADSTKHSPILGYAFDGYPIYGPYGYANSNGTGGIKRMVSSYQLRNMTSRTSLPDGTQLTSSEYGPDVSSQYPLGYFIEDYKYVAGSGDLDQYNGRFTVTPEYPNGTYAYFVTINADGSSAYPYIIGPQYYGVVDRTDIKTQGHITINETVQDYTTSTAIKPDQPSGKFTYSLMQNYPNPFNPTTVIRYSLPSSQQVKLEIYNMLGQLVETLVNKQQPTGSYAVNFDADRFNSGMYFYRLTAGNYTKTMKMLLLK